MTEEIRRLVLEFFAGNETKADLWFRLPNQLLGGTAPVKMIEMGREDRLLRFVREQLAQNEKPSTE